VRTPWLDGVLTRGTPADPGHPWRPGPAETWDAELRAGLVQRVVGDVLVAADVTVDGVDAAGLRGRALALLVPGDVVVLGAAAVWVHLGSPVPTPREVHVAGRRTPEPGGGIVVVPSRVRPAAFDVALVGPLRVSCPARALLEAATTHPHRAARWRSALTAAGLLDADAVAGASDAARGRAGVRVARRALSLPRSASPRRVSPSAAARP
jgi:hypothetical protein